MGVSTSGHNGDADLERALDFVSQWGSDGCTAYNSYDELVANADIDIIYIGTKTKDHCEHSLLAIAAGKHVLCEKPIAENAADAASMHAAAEEAGVFLQDAMWTRFFPAVEHARVLLEDGSIGSVNSLHSDFPDPCYDFQYAPMVFGAANKPTAVVATGGPTPGAARAAIAQYGSDGVAVFPLSTFGVEFPEITEIYGSKGRITLEQPGHCPTTITIRRHENEGPYRYRNSNTPAPIETVEYPLPMTIATMPNQGGFVYMGNAVHRCVAAGLTECPQYPKADSMATMELIDATAQNTVTANM